jgi:crotonobetainyl-CoA:carnitine CoA-transferase CaiB-like acyl-CoA transferase
MAAAPLAHVRVVDLTDLRGALAGRVLADLGADVVKVEPPAGDPGRLTPPFAADVALPDRSLSFLFRNLGKRGAVIDLARDDGRRRFAALCDAADVLVENLDPADPRREPLAPAAVAARHPHLVHVQLADFGRSGPRADWRLEALPAFAASGALRVSGFPDRPPCWLPGHQAHDAASLVAVAGALAALADRARHGRGQTVEVSVQEAALASFAPWEPVLAEYARVYPALPPEYPRDADGPALVVPVADGWIRTLAVTPRQLRALLALLAGRDAPAGTAGRHGEPRPTGVVGAGLDAVAAGGRRAANAAIAAVARLPVGGRLLPAVHAALAGLRFVATEALRGRARDDVVAEGLRLGLPIAPVHTPEEFVAAPQTRARAYFRATGFPHLADAPVAPFPARFSRTPVVLSRPAPGPGDDDAGFGAPPTRPAPAAAPAGPVLADLRVVSLGVGAVVPELCTFLGDLGAEVIKLESAASPDFLRRLSLDPPEHSPMFNDENRGQRSIAVDLRTPRGRDLALRLCARADIVAENRQGGLLERLGLGCDAVRRVRPDVIYVASQGFGRGGPLDTAPAYGPLAAAFAGATLLWNHPDAPRPGGSSLEHPDHVAGKLAAVAVLAALEHRRRTGEGQHVELAQSETAAFLLGEQYLERPLTGRPARATGNAAAYACPHGVYPAAGTDRWIAIAAVGEPAWRALSTVVGELDDPRFATLSGRIGARPLIDARVGAWTRERDAERAAATLQAAGVSAMPVDGAAELLDDPHLAVRGAFVRLDDPGVGSIRHVATPLRLGLTPLVPPRPAPRLGADTADVLGRWLGLGPSDVAALVADGVCR